MSGSSILFEVSSSPSSFPSSFFCLESDSGLRPFFRPFSFFGPVFSHFWSAGVEGPLLSEAFCPPPPGWSAFLLRLLPRGTFRKTEFILPSEGIMVLPQ